MGKWVYALAGLSLFVAGLGVGIAVPYFRTAELPVAMNQSAPERKQDAAKKALNATPSVADDRHALIGTWIREDNVGLLRVTKGKQGESAYILSGHGAVSLDFGLVDRDSIRVLAEEFNDTDGDHLNPLYEYQLRGDRLELKLLPGAAAKYGERPSLKVLDSLAGTWFRVRIDKGADPGTASAHRRTPGPI